MNQEVVQLYEELKVIYPNRTLVLDYGINPGGVSWLDIDRVGIIFVPGKEDPFEIYACPPGCALENHAFEVHGDIFFKTKEECIIAVRNLLDNNGYTHP